MKDRLTRSIREIIEDDGIGVAETMTTAEIRNALSIAGEPCTVADVQKRLEWLHERGEIQRLGDPETPLWAPAWA